MVSVNCEHLDIAKIADSGQCFRMNKLENGNYRAIAKDKSIIITPTESGAKFLCTQQEYDDFWRNYFDMNTEYAEFSKNILESDAFLTKAAVYSKGVRILKQDAWEMLVTFIISQRKNIPAIKKSVEVLCEMCGAKLCENECDTHNKNYAFPTPQQVARLTESQLNSCSLGYRTKYIMAAAQMVASGILNLEELSEKSNDDLRAELLTVPGVGEKVANCVMLFGYYRANSFPRDVWINRVINTVYSGEFDTQRFVGYEGVIQQYMFYFGRSDECAEKFLNA